jgi:hypothetical protein
MEELGCQIFADAKIVIAEYSVHEQMLSEHKENDPG